MRNRIKHIRMSRGLTQRKLSELSGVPIASLVRYENGIKCPKIEVAKKIADALGCTIDDLVKSK